MKTFNAGGFTRSFYVITLVACVMSSVAEAALFTRGRWSPFTPSGSTRAPGDPSGPGHARPSIEPSVCDLLLEDYLYGVHTLSYRATPEVTGYESLVVNQVRRYPGELERSGGSFTRKAFAVLYPRRLIDGRLEPNGRREVFIPARDLKRINLGDDPRDFGLGRHLRRDAVDKLIERYTYAHGSLPVFVYLGEQDYDQLIQNTLDRFDHSPEPSFSGITL